MKNEPFFDESVITALRELSNAANDYVTTHKMFTKCCRDRGIDWGAARVVLMSKNAERLLIDSERKLTPTRLDFEGLGCEQLYADVFGLSPTQVAGFALPSDAEETVEYCLAQLPKRVELVLRSYYGINAEGISKDLSECAMQFGVTRERIRQLQIKGVRMLAYPSRAEILSLGLAQWKKEQEYKERVEAAKQYEREKVQAELDWSEHVCSDVNSTTRSACPKATARAAVRACAERGGVDVNVDKFIADNRIEELDFSVRTYNVLKRAGIDTVGDLVSKSEDDLMKIQNLGRKSVEEINFKVPLYRNEKYGEFISVGAQPRHRFEDAQSVGAVLRLRLEDAQSASESASEKLSEVENGQD